MFHFQPTLYYLSTQILFSLFVSAADIWIADLSDIGLLD